MNNGAPQKEPGNSLPYIMKNTIPFQAKVNARYAFMRLFVLALGLANKKYVNVIHVTIAIICIGKIAMLYVPLMLHQSSPFIAQHLWITFPSIQFNSARILFLDEGNQQIPELLSEFLLSSKFFMRHRKSFSILLNCLFRKEVYIV